MAVAADRTNRRPTQPGSTPRGPACNRPGPVAAGPEHTAQTQLHTEEYRMPNEKSVAEIRRLNDKLRCQRQGGEIVITRGIASLGPHVAQQVLAAVASFDAFDGDNDPYGEHDCATLEIEPISVLWK